MKGTLILSLLSTLVLSIILHLSYFVRYLFRKDFIYIRKFFSTALSNCLIAVLIIVIALTRQEFIRETSFKMFLWLTTGYIMVTMLLVQMLSVKNMYRSSKKQEEEHKRMLEEAAEDDSGEVDFNENFSLPMDATRMEDFIYFFGSMPLLIFPGAYFIAKLIFLTRYGQL